MPHRIALVGDYSDAVLAHRAIPQALVLASRTTTTPVDWKWIRTREITDAIRDLADFSGVWVVPASPYENKDGALAAIRFARETRRPFLGTCGGFQHAIIEFARNVARIAGADHAETNPAGDTLVVTPLQCALRDQTTQLRLMPGSLIATAYQRGDAAEGYNCSYGINGRFRERLETAGLRFTAFDMNGDIRAAELASSVHPFFVGTLFQPERAALRGETPPLVRAFVHAVAQRRP